MKKQTFNIRFKLLPTFLILAAIIFIVFTGQNSKMVSTETSAPSRVQRSVQNDSFPPCSPLNFTMKETLDDLVADMGYYTLLLRMNVSVLGVDTSNYSTPDVINPFMWHWALGTRGKALLTFPRDFMHLSLGTLQPGVRDFTLSFRANQEFISMDMSDKEACLYQSLSNMSRIIRTSVEENGGELPDVNDDLICREKFVASLSPWFTKLPGYALFDLQGSSQYLCNLNIRKDARIMIYWLAGITVALVVTFMVVGVWVFLRGTMQFFARETKVNILQISLIPPLWLLGESCKWKNYFLFWYFVVLLPVGIYIWSFAFYVVLLTELNNTQMLLDGCCRNVLFGFNIVVLVGPVIVTPIAQFFLNDDNGINSRKWIILQCINWGFGVFVYSSSVLFLLEIIFCFLVGVALNFHQIPPTWINVILAVLTVIGSVVHFLNSYQKMYQQIHKVGAEIDKENLGYKIFTRKNLSGSEVPHGPIFEIEVSLLSDILKQKLPIHVQLWNTVSIAFPILLVLTLVGVIVAVIDRQTDISKLGEYIFTGVSLLLLGLAKVKSNPFYSESKQELRNVYKQNILETGLREYATTKKLKFPDSSVSCWIKYCKCICCLTCCCEYCETGEETPDDNCCNEKCCCCNTGSVTSTTAQPPTAQPYMVVVDQGDQTSQM